MSIIRLNGAGQPDFETDPSRGGVAELSPMWNVVLLNDDDHTYEYVIRMLGALFHHSREQAYAMAKEVDTTGRVIVLTTGKEQAEFKRDQIHAYGKDDLIERCAGSMSAIIEQAT
ncbi:MAG: ATP-dependent Clp protease adaptor ClpS [Planctomycetota bacterium]